MPKCCLCGVEATPERPLAPVTFNGKPICEACARAIQHYAPTLNMVTPPRPRKVTLAVEVTVEGADWPTIRDKLCEAVQDVGLVVKRKIEPYPEFEADIPHKVTLRYDATEH